MKNQKTIKVLEENIGKYLCIIMSKAKISQMRHDSERKNINNMSPIKIKNPFSEDNVKELKTGTKDWDKIFANHISGKGHLSRIYQIS